MERSSGSASERGSRTSSKARTACAGVEEPEGAVPVVSGCEDEAAVGAQAHRGDPRARVRERRARTAVHLPYPDLGVGAGRHRPACVRGEPHRGRPDRVSRQRPRARAVGEVPHPQGPVHADAQGEAAGGTEGDRAPVAAHARAAIVVRAPGQRVLTERVEGVEPAHPAGHRAPHEVPAAARQHPMPWDGDPGRARAVGPEVPQECPGGEFPQPDRFVPASAEAQAPVRGNRHRARPERSRQGTERGHSAEPAPRRSAHPPVVRVAVVVLATHRPHPSAPVERSGHSVPEPGDGPGAGAGPGAGCQRRR